MQSPQDEEKDEGEWIGPLSTRNDHSASCSSLSLERVLSSLDFSRGRMSILESFMRKFRTSSEDLNAALTKVREDSKCMQNRMHTTDAVVADLKHEMQIVKNQLAGLQGEVGELKREKQQKSAACAREVLFSAQEAHDLEIGASSQKQHQTQLEAMKNRPFMDLLAQEWQTTAWVPLPSLHDQNYIALLFPPAGLGLWNDGIRYVSAEARSNPIMAQMFNIAESVLGQNMFDSILHGPPWKDGRHVCAAVYLESLFCTAALSERCIEAVARPCAVAGFHEGEYAALCVAGVLTFEDALQLVVLRNGLMHNIYSAKKHMVMPAQGLPYDELKQLCEKASNADEVCFIADKYRRMSFLCGGTEFSMRALKKMVDEIGVARFGQMFVGASLVDICPGNSPLLKGAQLQFREELEKYLPRMSPPRCAVYMNASVEPIAPGTDPAVILEQLVTIMTQCVDWEQSLRSMIKNGASEFYDVGPTSFCKDRMYDINKKAWTHTQIVRP